MNCHSTKLENILSAKITHWETKNQYICKNYWYIKRYKKEKTTLFELNLLALKLGVSAVFQTVLVHTTEWDHIIIYHLFVPLLFTELIQIQ